MGLTEVNNSIDRYSYGFFRSSLLGVFLVLCVIVLFVLVLMGKSATGTTTGFLSGSALAMRAQQFSDGARGGNYRDGMASAYEPPVYWAQGDLGAVTDYQANNMSNEPDYGKEGMTTDYVKKPLSQADMLASLNGQ